MGAKQSGIEFKPEFPGQHEDEIVQSIFRQHMSVLRRPVLYGIVVLALSITPLAFPWVYSVSWLPRVLLDVFAVVCLIVALVWFLAWVGWYYTVYILTDRRLVAVKQKGFFDRSVTEWQLDKIYNVNYRVGGLQATIFGYGDITIKTAIGEFIMIKIYHPSEVHQQIMMAVRSVASHDFESFIDNSVSMM